MQLNWVIMKNSKYNYHLGGQKLKIGDLEQHCGNCKIIDLCGEPYSDVCLCCNEKLKDMQEDEYLVRVAEIRDYAKRNWSNKTLEKMIIKSLNYHLNGKGEL